MISEKERHDIEDMVLIDLIKMLTKLKILKVSGFLATMVLYHDRCDRELRRIFNNAGDK